MRIPTISGFDQAAFEKYFKNTGWLMFGKILSMVVGFLIARYLGPKSFGDLSFAQAFTALFVAVGSLGLDTFIIREIIQNPANRDEILGTSFFMRLTVSLFIIPVTILTYFFFRDNNVSSNSSLGFIIALCSIASLFKSFNIIDSYFQSQVQSKYVVHVQNVCLFISAIIKIVFVYLNLPITWFAGALLLDAVMLASGLIIMYNQQTLRISDWKFNRHRALSLLNKSWPLILSSIMVSVYMYIDQVMLKGIAGSKVVGIYSSAARISEAWYFIPVAIVTSVFPALIHARETDFPRYKKRLQNLYDLLVLISLPIAIAISFFADDIINILYGTQYEGAGLMLSVHIWSGIFVFLGSASSQYLLAEGYTQISFIRTFVGAIVNILLNMYLIPLYGGLGASVATLIAYFVAAFFIVIIPRTREQGLMMFKSLFLISPIQNLVRK